MPRLANNDIRADAQAHAIKTCWSDAIEMAAEAAASECDSMLFATPVAWSDRTDYVKNQWRRIVSAILNIQDRKLDAANARIAALEEALTPFAEFADVVNEPEQQFVHGRGYAGKERSLRARDFFRAARLLSPSPEHTEGI